MTEERRHYCYHCVGGRGAPRASQICPDGIAGCKTWSTEVPPSSEVGFLVFDTGFCGTVHSSSSRTDLNS